MPQFKYQGRTEQGSEVSGEMESANTDGVVSNLIRRNIIPVKITEYTPRQNILTNLQDIFESKHVETKDLIMFARQMYTVSKSGLPLTRGIRSLTSSLRNPYFKAVLLDVADTLEEGSSLSRSMRNYPDVFSHLFYSMVEVGEASGNLDLIFQQIAFYLERDEQTRKSVKQATRYPMFVCIAICLAMVAVNIWVIPAFSDMFKQFNADLPIITRILIGTSDFFVNFWPFLLIVTISLFVSFLVFKRTKQGELLVGRYLLRLPIAGDLINRACMARYARSMALMLKAGLPVNQALSLCAAAIDNVYLGVIINEMRDGIERGESMLKTHMQANLFTPLVIQMISVGEDSGQIDTLLQDVAEFYEREVDYDLKTLTDKIEPILIVIMAAFVGLLAVGIFLPMWSMYDIQS